MRSYSSKAKKILSLLVLPLLLLSCRGVTESDLGRLSGYWEIARVGFPDGDRKEYKVNTSVDYFELQGSSGYRKKLLPNADGTFDTSDDALPFAVVTREGHVFLRFQGDSDTWEEEIVKLTTGELVLSGPRGLQYEYQRYEPVAIPVSNGTK